MSGNIWDIMSCLGISGILYHVREYLGYFIMSGNIWDTSSGNTS